MHTQSERQRRRGGDRRVHFGAFGEGRVHVGSKGMVCLLEMST
jgi:hypothetical protein